MSAAFGATTARRLSWRCQQLQRKKTRRFKTTAIVDVKDCVDQTTLQVKRLRPFPILGLPTLILFLSFLTKSSDLSVSRKIHLTSLISRLSHF